MADPHRPYLEHTRYYGGTRTEQGLKQKDAARMIGISATTFSDLLHGRRALSFDIARSLHKVLGVPADIVLA